MSDNYITKEEILSFVEEMEKRTHGDDLITKTVLATTKCVKDFVMHMPSADVQPVVQWIPCSERLPEKYGNYLVTTDDGEVDIGSCDPENKDRQYHFWSGCDADGFFWYGENIVIAWMSLPKSYMRGEQDEH